ncbi:hypothetical protein [Pseudonocardia sp. GCM10023141]|uniref:hypothetical protein n=1 Tax=Pseudonocardia sp. GCM10023141 TaxID=3252653 RepID=UPI0036086C60
MSPSTSLPRPALHAVLAASALLVSTLLLGGCSTSVAGVPTASTGTITSDPGVPPVTSSPPSTGSSVPASGGCKVTLGRGNVTISGGGGRAVTSNGATSFSCRSGPLIAVGQIAENSVSFTVNGVNATITVNSTVSTGPYTISVISIVNGTATLQVVPNS